MIIANYQMFRAALQMTAQPLHLGSSCLAGLTKIVIADIFGRIIKTILLNNNETVVDVNMENVQDGIYI